MSLRHRHWVFWRWRQRLSPVQHQCGMARLVRPSTSWPFGVDAGNLLAPVDYSAILDCWGMSTLSDARDTSDRRPSWPLCDIAICASDRGCMQGADGTGRAAPACSATPSSALESRRVSALYAPYRRGQSACCTWRYFGVDVLRGNVRLAGELRGVFRGKATRPLFLAMALEATTTNNYVP